MSRSSGVILLFLALTPLFSSADDGMWLFDRFPTAAVKEKYATAVTPEFLDNLRLGTVRLGATGAGAIVSANGLLLTNQHLVASCIPNLRGGFYAAQQSDEAHCTGLEGRVLVAMDDVTAQFPVVSKKINATERTAAIAKLESQCAASHAGESCEVVSLFSGSRYELYRYKRYTDVRLVFAPEQQLAFFGRERDSITYLRYGLDIAFVRLYDGGKPLETAHHLRWNTSEIKEGDLVFATGNPRTTVRETTAAQLTFYRDTLLPLELSRLGKRIAVLPEDNRRRIALVEEYKSLAGKLIGLRDDRLVLRKTAFDSKIRRAVEADSKLGAEAAKVWDQVATAYKNWTPNERAYQILEAAPAPGCELFRIARAVIRDEPVEGRMEIDETSEVTFLAQYLEELKTLADHGDKEIHIKQILEGQTPQAAAETYVHGSHLRNPAQRRVDSDDSMIHLAQLIEPAAQHIRKKHDETIIAVEASASAQIAQYRYRLFGDAEYPDATGTPRVEFGVLKSYLDRAGTNEPYAATFSGLYYRQNNQGPYQVPERWIKAKDSLNSITPLDFVSTCDIGGGEDGAPTVNRDGELVGIIFDGNLESLPNTYLYTDDQARAVHVATTGIVEALEKVYKSEALLRELQINTGAISLNHH